MTPVAFHFLTPQGVPISNASFEVQLVRSSFNNQINGVILPRAVFGTTDDDGRCVLELWPLSAVYHVVMYDPTGDAGIHFKFTVPEVASGSEPLDLQDLIVASEPTSGGGYSEEALLMILSAKGAVLAARNQVINTTSQFTGQAERAEAAAEAAEAAAASIVGGGGSGPANNIYAKRSDVVSPTVIYRGESANGTTEATSGWRISKITVTYGNPIATQTLWASGTQAFDKKWTDRATYTYI